MTVQRRGGPLDPPTRMYRPVSKNTGPDEDPDQVVDEWEEALRGDQRSPRGEEPTATPDRGVDPPTRQWTWPISTRRTDPAPAPKPAPSRPDSTPAELLWTPPKQTVDYPTRTFGTPRGDRPRPSTPADDSGFADFSEDPYLPPVHEPDAEPDPEPKPKPTAKRGGTATDRPTPTPRPTPAPRAPEPDPKPEPEPEEPKPAPPGAVAAQLFGTYPGVEEQVATHVMPRIVDVDPVPDASPPKPAPPQGLFTSTVERPDRERVERDEPDPQTEDVDLWPEVQRPADDDREPAEDEHEPAAATDTEDEPTDADAAADTALDHPDPDHPDLDDTDLDHPEADQDEPDHAELERDEPHDTPQPADAEADTAHAEPDHTDLDEYPDAAGRPAARPAEDELGDTAEWTMDASFDDEDDDEGADEGAGAHNSGHHDDYRDALVAEPAREAHTELIPRVTDLPTGVHTSVDHPTVARSVVDQPTIARRIVAPRHADHEEAEAPARPARPATRGSARPLAAVLALLLVTMVAGAGAYICWTKAQEAQRAQPTGNVAFVDKAVTADVRDQVSKAVEAIYSYDTAHLDQDEQRALSFITGSYADEFKQNFTKVRELGPQQKASLVSTVAEAGVERVNDRRATLLLMVNQVGHRSDSAAPLKASVRLSVTAERVDGQWKVSGINQR